MSLFQPSFMAPKNTPSIDVEAPFESKVVSLENMVKNGSFETSTLDWNYSSNGSQYRVSTAKVYGNYGLEYNFSDAQVEMKPVVTHSYIPGHKYYMSCNYNLQESENTITLGVKSANGIADTVQVKTSDSKVWLRYNKIFSGSASTEFGWVFQQDFQGKVRFWLDGFMIIDLTEAFGEGNEPTVIDMITNIEENGGFWSGEKNVNFKPSTYKDVDDMVFSCQLNGTSPLLAFNIKIYEMKNASEDTGENVPVYETASSENKDALEKKIEELNNALSDEQTAFSNNSVMKKKYEEDQTINTFIREFTQNKGQLLGLAQQVEEIAAGQRPVSYFVIVNEQVHARTSELLEMSNDFKEYMNTTYKYYPELYEQAYLMALTNINSSLAKIDVPLSSGQVTLDIVSEVININNVMYELTPQGSSDTAYVTNNNIQKIMTDMFNAIGTYFTTAMEKNKEVIVNYNNELSALQTAADNLDKGYYVLEKPVYPVDMNGKAVTFKHTVPYGVLENGKNYKWTIDLYWSTTNQYSNIDSHLLSYETYFEARTTPEIDIENFSPTLSRKDYEFRGSYIQKEGVPINAFRWKLWDGITDDLIKDTGWIPSADIGFYYDGFQNEKPYKIQLMCESTTEVVVQTSILEFTSKNIGIEIENSVTARTDDSEHGIIVTWGGLHMVTGEIEGSYEYLENMPVEGQTALHIKKNSTLTFDKDGGYPLQIPTATSTHVISFRIDPEGADTIYECRGTVGDQPYYRRLSVNGNLLTYDVNGVKKYNALVVPNQSKWYVAFMFPDGLQILEKWSSGLFPNDYPGSSYLFPHPGLYPESLTYNNPPEPDPYPYHRD